MFSKLFSSILDSSVWGEKNATRLVWLTLLASKDKDGFARYATVMNLALRARVSKGECEEAVQVLEAPDPESSNTDHEGRRIERVPGGWMVLNAPFYDKLASEADRREQTRVRVANHRARKLTSQVDELTKSTMSTPRQQVEPPPPDPAFEQFWASYPKRAGSNPRRKAQEHWNARVKFGINPLAMQDGAVRYGKFCEATGKLGTEYVMQAVRFLGPECPFNEPWTLPQANDPQADALAQWARETDAQEAPHG